VGRFCKSAYRHGWDVTGIDISEKAIALGSVGAKFPMLNTSLQELSARGERYQVITAFEVIEHLSAPTEFLAAVREALAPGGQFFCTVPNWNSEEVQTSTRPDNIPPVHLCFYSQSTLERLARECGFTVISSGLIQTDHFPRNPFKAIRWCVKRLYEPVPQPVGIWLYLCI
jgi:2-polyprenyl-3-methyl-5-hydroxy-6-metoxy-1,4-benzoquinol methylase